MRYFEIYNKHTFDLFDLYEGMREEGKLMKVFHNVDTLSYSDFREIMKRCWLYLGFEDSRLVGAIWFSNFTKESCNLHFCSLKGYKSWLWSAIIGNLLQIILDKSGKSCYAILASTPYKGLTRMFKHMGFRLMNESKGLYNMSKVGSNG